MKNLFSTIRTALDSFLFPKACIGCKTPGTALCESCFSTIKPSSMTDHPLIYGIYNYGSPIVSEAIWALKYKRKSAAAKELLQRATPTIGEILGEHIQGAHEEKLIIVPIPQHKKKTQKRGFNQSLLLAQYLSQTLPGSKVSELLIKEAETIPQSHLADRNTRIKNVSGTMKAKSNLSDGIYILIDDVTTTGATFLEGMRALKAAGAKNVIAIALAHGYKRR